MTVLVVEDDPDLQELIAIQLETRFQADVKRTDQVAVAIETLKAKPGISCIISDYHLTDGTGGQIFEYLKVTQSNIPFCLCSSIDPANYLEFQGGGLSGYVQKPFNTVDLLTQVKPLMQMKQSMPDLGETITYTAIRLRILSLLNVLPCDVYMKLSDIKYVKVAHANTTFDDGDFNRFRKSVEHLYICTDQLDLLLNKFTQDTLALSQSKNLPPTLILKTTELSHSFLYQTISKIGFTDAAQDLAMSCTMLALRVISHDPAFTPFSERLSSGKNHYLTQHCILLAQTSCLLASLLGWKSERTQFKLALAALVHDLTLENDKIAVVEVDDPEMAHCSEGVKEKVRSHPKDGSQLLLKMKQCPSDVELIVLEHHERPNGSGYPFRKSSSSISPLSSVFIVAHDIINYLWMLDDKGSVNEFLNLYSNDYKSGTFKLLHDKLKLQLKVEIEQ